jgi:hypothetical protein
LEGLFWVELNKKQIIKRGNVRERKFVQVRKVRVRENKEIREGKNRFQTNKV